MTVDDRGEGELPYLVRPDDVISGQPHMRATSFVLAGMYFYFVSSTYNISEWKRRDPWESIDMP